MLERLKAITQPDHARLDRLPRLQRLLAADISLDEYRDALATFYSLYAPLEARLAVIFADSAFSPDFEARRRTGRLARDLEDLGIDARRSVALRSIPELTSLAAGWGVLYVLEGSTLGAQVIVRQLQRSLGRVDGPLRFFHGHGAETKQKWQNFRDALASWMDLHPEECPKIFTAASAGFQAFETAFASSPHARE